MPGRDKNRRGRRLYTDSSLVTDNRDLKAQLREGLTPPTAFVVR